jgi:hypothetical protein
MIIEMFRKQKFRCHLAILLVIALVLSPMSFERSVTVKAAKKVYTWQGAVSGDSELIITSGAAVGTTPVTDSSDFAYAPGYDCGLEVINPYNDVLTGSDVYFGTLLADMENPTVIITTQTGGDAYAYDWSVQIPFVSGQATDISAIKESYLANQKGMYLAFFGGSDTITKIELYDAETEEEKGASIAYTPKPTQQPLPTHVSTDTAKWEGTLYADKNDDLVTVCETSSETFTDFTGENWGLWGGGEKDSWAGANFTASMDLSAYDKPVVKICGTAQADSKQGVAVTTKDETSSDDEVKETLATEEGAFETILSLQASAKLKMVVVPESENVTITSIEVYNKTEENSSVTETPTAEPTEVPTVAPTAEVPEVPTVEPTAETPTVKPTIVSTETSAEASTASPEVKNLTLNGEAVTVGKQEEFYFEPEEDGAYEICISSEMTQGRIYSYRQDNSDDWHRDGGVSLRADLDEEFADGNVSIPYYLTGHKKYKFELYYMSNADTASVTIQTSTRAGNENGLLWHMCDTDQSNTDYAVIYDYLDMGAEKLTIPSVVGDEVPVKKINDWAISSGNVKTLTIEEGVEQLGANNPIYCNNLETVILPSTIYDIGDDLFYSGKVTSISLPNGSDYFYIANDALMSIYGAFHYYFGTSAEEYTIQEGVTQLVDRCFEGKEIKKLVMPSTLKSMSQIGCSNLEAIDFSKNSNCYISWTPTEEITIYGKSNSQIETWCASAENLHFVSTGEQQKEFTLLENERVQIEKYSDGIFYTVFEPSETGDYHIEGGVYLINVLFDDIAIFNEDGEDVTETTVLSVDPYDVAGVNCSFTGGEKYFIQFGSNSGAISENLIVERIEDTNTPAPADTANPTDTPPIIGTNTPGETEEPTQNPQTSGDPTAEPTASVKPTKTPATTVVTDKPSQSTEVPGGTAKPTDTLDVSDTPLPSATVTPSVTPELPVESSAATETPSTTETPSSATPENPDITGQPDEMPTTTDVPNTTNTPSTVGSSQTQVTSSANGFFTTTGSQTTGNTPTVGTIIELDDSAAVSQVEIAENGNVVLLKGNNTTTAEIGTVEINGETYTVTEVQNNAYKNSKKLKKVTLGKSVQKIGTNAFAGCKNLKNITFASTKVPKIGKNAFKNINKKAKIYVPKRSFKAYKKKIKSCKWYKKSMKIIGK